MWCNVSLAVFTVLLLLPFANAAPNDMRHLEIKVTNLVQQESTLHLAIYESEQHMTMKQGVFKTISLSGDLHSLTLDVALEYQVTEAAVLVYQDLNNNQKLDANLFGIPSEPYGVSNNPNLMGPPNFAQAVFPLNTLKQAVSITLF